MAESLMQLYDTMTETAQKELRRRRGGKKMVIIYDKKEAYISKSKYIF
jgi:hypothetical protein